MNSHSAVHKGSAATAYSWKNELFKMVKEVHGHLRKQKITIIILENTCIAFY